MFRVQLLAALAAFGAPTTLGALPAQPQDRPSAAQSPSLAVPRQALAPSCVGCIPKLTPAQLMIDADLGSKISASGEMFPLHLIEPIAVDGHDLIPAGIEGQGEVVHAKKASAGGSPGELVLAARFLVVADRRLRLRSMRIAVAGKDASQKVDALNAAAAGASVLTPVPLGFLGFAITGRNIVVPKGTLASAKTAEDFPIDAGSIPNAETGAAADKLPPTN